MNLFSYVDKFGCYSFEEVPFNEVDNAIFASLSYINFEGIVPSNRYNKISIKNAAFLYFNNHDSSTKSILAVRQAVKLLNAIKNTRRYSELYLYNYVYEFGQEEQFSAITIEINSKLVYVSYEGTDHLVSGWKEDAMMAYTFPVESQRRAIDYINKNFFFRHKEIILGGHSKGGNLAMVAGMYANFWVKDKIIKIYNNDGPGLLLEQINSKYYDSIRKKLVHIVPNYSIVGLLLYHEDNYIVVRSFRKGIWAHDIFSWCIKDNSFMRSPLDSFSKSLDEEMITWLKMYDIETRKRFIFSMFDILEKANVVSVLDVVENKKLIIDLIKIAKISEDDKKIMRDFIKMLYKCFIDVKREQLSSLFTVRNSNDS